jgi:hypothetical protein
VPDPRSLGPGIGVDGYHPSTGDRVEANLLNFDERHLRSGAMESSADEMYSDPQRRVRGILVVQELEESGERLRYAVLEDERDTGYTSVEPDTIELVEEAAVTLDEIDMTRFYGNLDPDHVFVFRCQGRRVRATGGRGT